jgi:hypothetical protein
VLRRWRLGLFALIGLLAVSSRGEAADLRVTFEELTRLVQTIASNAKLYLNNAPGPFAGLFTAGSYLAITPAQQYPLEIGDAARFPFQGSVYQYYVNDVGSAQLSVAPADGALRLTILFEAEGYEFVAGCIEGPCTWLDALPDIEWISPAVYIDFVPEQFNGSISLRVKNVRIGGTPRAVCKSTGDLVSRGACNLIARPYANRTLNDQKTKLPEKLKQHVNQEQVKQRFADGLKRYLALGQAGEVAIGRISVRPNSMTVSFRFKTGESAGN